MIKRRLSILLVWYLALVHLVPIPVVAQLSSSIPIATSSADNSLPSPNLVATPAPATSSSYPTLLPLSKTISIPPLAYPFAGTYPESYNFGEVSLDPLITTQQQSLGLSAHDGIDFALPYATPVLASDKGVVTFAGEGLYGLMVVVTHDWGQSYYGHLSSLEVTLGARVVTGDRLGNSGDSGIATGPHLHFSIRPTQSQDDNGFAGMIDPTPHLQFIEAELAQVQQGPPPPPMLKKFAAPSPLEPATTLSLELPTETGTYFLHGSVDPSGTVLPDFELTGSLSEGTAGLLQRARRLFLKAETLTASIFDADNTLIESHTYPRDLDSTTLIPDDLQPGRYSLVLGDSTTGQSVKQDFRWGVLAFNSNQATYQPDQTGKLTLAVLDDQGEMVCDAGVTLTVTDPSGSTTTMSTDNGGIKVDSVTCASKDFTLSPDFESRYQTGLAGTYRVNLTATTDSGTYSIQDSFLVENSPPFHLSRRSATRLYPKHIYPMYLRVTPTVDYQGSITEKVPSNFRVGEAPPLDTSVILLGLEDSRSLSTGSYQPPALVNLGSHQTLTWQVSWTAGQTYTLAYTYDAPDESPQFYSLGPSMIGSTAEYRSWQLAIDASGSGTNTVDPTTATASSTGNTHTFTYNPSDNQPYGGDLVVTVPTNRGWSTPQGTGGTAGYTTASVGSSTVVVSADSTSEGSWTLTEDDSDTCNTVELNISTTVKAEGTGSVHCGNAANTSPDGTDSFTFDHSSTDDWSGYDTIGFWVRTDTAITDSNRMFFGYSTGTSLDTVVEEYGIGPMVADSWTYHIKHLTGTRTAVKSVGLRTGGEFDNANVYLDEISLGKAVIGTTLVTGDSTSEGSWTLTEDDSDTCNTNELFVDTTVKFEGTGAIKCDNSTSTSTDSDDSFTWDHSSTVDWSSYTTIAYWVRTTKATASTDAIDFAYSTGTSLDTPIAYHREDDIAADTWTYKVHGLQGTRTAVKSFGLSADGASFDNSEVWLDEVIIGPGVPSYAVSGSDYDIKTKFIVLDDAIDVTVTYGAGGGTSGATAPASGGTDEFTTYSRIATSSSYDTATEITTSPTITVSGSSTIDISGTANGNNGATVRYAVNGTIGTETGSIGSGTWLIDDIDSPSSDDIITVWVDNVDDSSESTAVTKFSASDVTGMVLDTNVLSLGSNQDTGLTVTNLNQYDCSDDEDIMHQAGSSHLKVEGDSCAGSTSNSYSSEELEILSGDSLTVGSSETLTTYDLTITGTLTTTSSGTYNVSHNWVKTGTFTASTGTVNLTGGGGTTQTISGANSFYTLSATGSSARTIKFPSSTTTAITNSLTLTGASGQLLTLDPSTAATTWTIDPPASSVSVSYVSVTYSTATECIQATNSSGNNNTLWTYDGSACPATNFDFQTGYYMGTGVDDFAITGLGFQPDMVIIKDDTTNGADGALVKTSVMTGEVTARLAESNIDLATDGIQSLDSDGFTVGANTDVNNLSIRYTWMAYGGSDCTGSGTFCVGSYSGNGSSQSLTSVGFQPDFVTIKRSGADYSVFKTSDMGTNVSQYLTNLNEVTTTAYIQTLDSTGFTVGNSNNVNGSGNSYWFFAFKDVSGAFTTGTYTGNNTDNRSISVSFDPDAVWIKNSNATTPTFAYYNTLESDGDYSSSFEDAANLVGVIKSLDTGGYTIGTATASNENSKTIYWVAFGGSAAPSVSGTYDMYTGSYTGNGTSQSISGLGFSPDLVFIRDESGANYVVYTTRLMPPDNTAYFANAAVHFSDGITSLDSNGFSVGADASVNTNSTTYHYQAFGNAYDPTTGSGAADFSLGAYTGNGQDGRDILSTPFQADLINIRRVGAYVALVRTSSMAGDLTGFYHANGEAADFIQAINSDGFEVGTEARANNNNATIYYFAFKSGNNFKVGSFTGTGSAQDITSPGIEPDLVWVKKSTGVNGVLRPSSLAGNSTQYFVNTASESDQITALISNGFSVGDKIQTNASGGTYRYAVWGEPSGNTAPNTPTTLAQLTTGDITISTGGWHNTTSIKFTAQASDTDSSDTLYLCVEKDVLATGFSDTEDSCGSGVAYSGSAVSVSVTISSQTDQEEYHWQARVKDAAGAYSSWVSYDVNAESARDYGLDTTAPTGGTVYDGTVAATDAGFNDGSLSSLSANWDSFNSNISGLDKYQYSIGTTQGGTDIKDWTDNSTTTSVTATGLTLTTNTLYFVNVRAVDSAGNTGSTVSSNGQQVAPTLSFSVSPGTVTFLNLNPGNSYTDTQNTTLTTSTNAYSGYVVRAFVTDYLRSADTVSTIGDFSGGTYASPGSWGSNTGFGYTSSDTTIQGSDKFSGGTLYASFNQNGPGDIVADHTTSVSGTPVTSEQFTIYYKVTAPESQPAKDYQTTVVYTATAQY